MRREKERARKCNQEGGSIVLKRWKFEMIGGRLRNDKREEGRGAKYEQSIYIFDDYMEMCINTTGQGRHPAGRIELQEPVDDMKDTWRGDASK